ncbi:hypothetical protein U0021_09105 [Moraxella canis]|uniref:Uncharacterized protein n=1 Tax=Moraxella canis TaxID=90239 RepID=A0ABZ0WXQ2_9GAMM|nr:hypothetical protein [Moraxella canis]WQE03880.1 hypothetical protein U0021_09105 [Moraxella canis]
MSHIVGNSFMSFNIGNFESKKYIPITINFGRVEIGTLDDNTYIPSFIYSLKNLIENPYYFMNDIDNLNYKKIFKSDNGVVVDSHYFSLEDTFDDFTKIAIRNNDFIFFYFKLNKDHYFSYENINNNDEIYISLRIIDYISAVRDLEEFLAL